MSSCQALTPRPTSLVFEPGVGHHQAEHLLWIARAWQSRAPRGRRLVLAAPRELTSRRPEIESIVESSSVELDLTEAQVRGGGTLTGVLAPGRWDALVEAVRRHTPDRVLLSSLDHFLSPLATRRPLPKLERLGGILFRPTLHYSALGSPPESVREALHRWGKRGFVRAAFRHPRLTDVFSLDPTAVPALQALTTATVHGLLDPVPPEVPDESPGEVRQRYGVEPGRQLLAMAGALDDRKGVRYLLRALLALPDYVARRLSVILAGGVFVEDRAAFDRELAAASGANGLQVVFREGYLSPGDLAAVVAAADVFAAPYDRHVGSSGFVVRAAGAGVPVVAQSYGFVGHVVRTHGLGQTADPRNPEEFARAITRALEVKRSVSERAAAQQFAASHTVDAFTSPLTDLLIP